MSDATDPQPMSRAAAVTYAIGLPLILLALVFLPAMLAGALLIVRTGREDRLLQAGLSGYSDYARRVRYRLVPGLW